MISKYRNYPKVVVDSQLPVELKNRAHDIRQDEELDPNIEVTLYKIDDIIVTHLQAILPTLEQDGKSLTIPVMYATAERWKAIQADGVLRDRFDKIQLPIVVVKRNSMTEADMNSAVNKYNTYTVQQKFNRRNTYDKFKFFNEVKPSEKYYTMLIPDYYDISYEIYLWTDYISHMNTLTEAISFESDTYWGEIGNYRFLTEVGEFTNELDLPEANDRVVRTLVNLNVRAYLLPKYALDKNGMKQPVTQINYSPKKLISFIEIVGTGEPIAGIEDIPLP